MKPFIGRIITNKPNMTMFRSKAVVGVGGWTYNQVGLQYDAVGTLYGGSDRRTDLGPQLKSVSI